MSRFLAITIVFISLTYGVLGQNTYNKVIGYDSLTSYAPKVVKTASGHLISSLVSNYSTDEDFIGVFTINNTGKVLGKKIQTLTLNQIPRNGRNLTMSNGNVADYRTVQQYDTTLKNYRAWTELYMFNQLGDTLWTKSFFDSSKHVVARTLIETPDSGLFLIGDERITLTNHNPLIIRVDKYGNEVSRRTNTTVGNTALFSVIKHPNGKYYGGGYSASGNYADAFVTEMDTNMQPIWSKYYTSRLGHAALLCLLKDGNMVFGTDTLVEERGSSRIKYMRKQLFKIDTNGVVIWRKVHDELGESNYYRQGVEAKNGDLLFIGRRQPQEGIHYTLTRLKANGDTIWMHQYAYEDIETVNYMYDMVAMDDGGVLMVGDVIPNDKRYQHIWLLRVDSNGCYDNNCAQSLVYDMRLSVTEKNQLNKAVSIYPNPSKGNQFLSIKGLNHQIKYGAVLTDISGKVVHKAALLNSNKLHLPKLPEGVYAVRIFNGSELFAIKKLVIE